MIVELQLLARKSVYGTPTNLGLIFENITKLDEVRIVSLYLQLIDKSFNMPEKGVDHAIAGHLRTVQRQPRFSHYNLMNHGADHTLDKATMEAIAKAAYGDRKHRVLAKEQYNAKAKHTGKCEVTVVGHRRIGRWEFWAQYLEDKQSGWQIRNVHKIV